MPKKAIYSKLIKEESKRLGFLSCGISKADFLEKEAPLLEKWLSKGMHGEMSYMEKNFDKRLDPRKLVDGAKSVISLLLNYYPSKTQNTNAPKISKYAYGKDYHFVIKNKLKNLLFFINEHIGEVKGRVFVDSAPVLDKAWAQKSGLGWIGKHTNLITKKTGSFYFIAELIVDIPLEYDNPVNEHCGTCTKCIDACPTSAIVSPYQLDAKKCISYLTIELKDNIPPHFVDKMDNWMFGCDVCQDVCPWNRYSKPHKEKEFSAKEELINYSMEEWEEMTEEVFNKVFKKSAVKRTKYKGLKRNIYYLKKQTKWQKP